MYVYVAPRDTVLCFPGGNLVLTEPWLLSSERTLQVSSGASEFTLKQSTVNSEDLPPVVLTEPTKQGLILDSVFIDMMSEAVINAFNTPRR